MQLGLHLSKRGDVACRKLVVASGQVDFRLSPERQSWNVLKLLPREAPGLLARKPGLNSCRLWFIMRVTVPFSLSDIMSPFGSCNARPLNVVARYF